ncbi:MAG TPA: flagellar motor switch phosphatase FliY [Clostridiales bacterium]|nr:flagellar motor switch phosphatase FliY [Clostridiales bacterium]
MEHALSQSEIDALLKGIPVSDINNIQNTEDNEELSLEEIDALGEIGNISIGTSATTLFTLLGQKITITTPKVTLTTWEQLAKEHNLPYVAIRVKYTAGLEGANLLILKEDDVKIITDLMMGGTGRITDGELTEMHLSAISEAMNQMIGSSATSMSTMFNKRIDISPPTAFIIKFDSLNHYDDFYSPENGKIVKVAFKMVVGDLIDSEIMQLLPLPFAKTLLNNLLYKEPETVKESKDTGSNIIRKTESYNEIKNEEKNQDKYQPKNDLYESFKQNDSSYKDKGAVNVQPVHFQSFEDETVTDEKQNIDIVMDIPLQVTVELGRTQKLIREILEFNYGTIVELDKLAGDPVDILVNGKRVAKGEVVVIDDSFGVRITDIVHPSKRF